MAGARKSSPAATKIETQINTDTYCEFHVETIREVCKIKWTKRGIFQDRQ